MTKSIRTLFIISTLGFATSAFACDYPDNVKVANGATATKDEMIASQSAVKKYVADMETYLECIVEEEKSARALIPDLEAQQAQEREVVLLTAV